MKNIKYLLIITAITVAGLTGCSKEKLEVWGETSRIWFANEDTLFTASFKKQPAGVDEFTANIPIQMAGVIATSDREVKVELLKDKRNPETVYTIEGAIVKADSSKGVLKVKVKKTANLSVVADTVNVILRTAGQFQTGLANNIKCTIVITNRYSKPWWWYDLWIGEYSEAKHDVLFAVFGNDDDIRGSASETNIRFGWSSIDAVYNLWKLNTYCEEHNLPFRFE